jgi:hypothetical protein
MDRQTLRTYLESNFRKIQMIAWFLIGAMMVYLSLGVVMTLYFHPGDMQITPDFFDILILVFYAWAIIQFPILILLYRRSFSTAKLKDLSVGHIFQKFTMQSFLRLGMAELPAVFGVIILLFTENWAHFLVLTTWSIGWIFIFFPRFRVFCRLIGLDSTETTANV